MTKLSGGCVCGAVRYEISAPPLMMFKCHCRTCQMVTGGAFTPVVVVAAKAFKVIQGKIKHHFTDKVTGGPRHQRGFCADCGSRLTGAEIEGESRRIMAVTASSLDDPAIFKPESDIFVAHAQPWDLMDPQLPKHKEYPPVRS